MFISKYLEVCHSKGLNLGNPTEWRILPSGQAYDDVVKPLYDRMVAAQGAGCKFVLVLTNKEDRPVHGSRYNEFNALTAVVFSGTQGLRTEA